MNNITVIGIGRLGLGFALMLEKSNYNVLGVDINEEYVDALNAKTFKCAEPSYDELLQQSKNFSASTKLIDGINHSDIIFIIVQTPNSGGERFYDHSILSNLLIKINKLKPTNKDFIIGCTVMPKYIDEVGNGLLNNCTNCHLSYNPEFVAQGDIINGFKFPDIILVGTNNENLKPKIKTIYEKMCEKPTKFCFLTPVEAEITKISINGLIFSSALKCNLYASDFEKSVINKSSSIILKTRFSNKFKASFNPSL